MDQAIATTASLQRASHRSRRDGLAALIDVCYDDLRRLAAARLRAEPRERSSVGATALVHEAYLRLADQRQADWTDPADRARLLVAATVAMRRVLIDRARRRLAFKRGGTWRPVDLQEAEGRVRYGEDERIDLQDELAELARVHARAARVVTLRFLSGATVDEVGHLLGVSARTVKGDLAQGLAWLRRRFDPERGR